MYTKLIRVCLIGIVICLIGLAVFGVTPRFFEHSTDDAGNECAVLIFTNIYNIQLEDWTHCDGGVELVISF